MIIYITLKIKNIPNKYLKFIYNIYLFMEVIMIKKFIYEFIYEFICEFCTINTAIAKIEYY